MNKQEFVQALRGSIKKIKERQPSESAIAVGQLLLTYIEQEYQGAKGLASIERRLPQLAAGAINAYHSSQQPWAVFMREGDPWLDSAKGMLSALELDVRWYNDLFSYEGYSSDVESLLYVLEESGVNVLFIAEVRAVLNTELNALYIVFYRFLQTVYAEGGMFDKIQEDVDKTRHVTCGKTRLFTSYSHSGVAITFSREGTMDDRVVFHVPAHERRPVNVSLNTKIDYVTACTMVIEVINKLPKCAKKFHAIERASV